LLELTVVLGDLPYLLGALEPMDFEGYVFKNADGRVWTPARQSLGVSGQGES
jgi:hypothetical protein